MSTAARRPASPPMALWLGASLTLHAGLFLLGLLGGGAWLARVGEHGHAGAGGPLDTVEVSLVVDEAPAEAAPAVGASGAIPDEVERTAPAAHDPGSVERVAQAMGTERRTGVPDASGTLVASPTSAESGPASGGTEGAPSSDPSGGGTEAASSGTGEETALRPDEAEARALILGSAGRLSGDTVRASALLGESLSCEDPVAGTWVAYRYSPEFRDWARFTLHIERNGGVLEGTIIARMWRGLPSERRPPPCGPDGWDYTVTMNARGNLVGDQMAFGATAHEVTRVDCASSFFSYNPDHFSGRVDGLSDRMHTVNNDGGRDINAPYEFRRTSCQS